MVAIVKRTITKKRRPQRSISRPRRQAKIAESTMTPSQQVLNVTEVAITDAYVTSGKGKKGVPTKTKSAEPLSTEIIITIIVIIALLGLLFWIFVGLYERERRAKKWEDYKIYKLELREYKRRIKQRRKRRKKYKKKDKIAKKGGTLHVPTDLQRKRRPKTQGSRNKKRLEKRSRSKERRSHSKENEPEWSLEKGTKEHRQDKDKREKSAEPADIRQDKDKHEESAEPADIKQDKDKREESAEPADIHELERAIKGGNTLLASSKEAPERKSKEEMVSLAPNREEEVMLDKIPETFKSRTDDEYEWLAPS